MRVFRRSVMAALLAMAACSPGPDAPLTNQGPILPTQTPWPQFVDATIQGWFAQMPSFAVYEGAHKFDGQLPDWSAAGLKARSAFLKDLIQKARAYDKLTPDQAFERDYLIKVAEGQLFWLEDANVPTSNPTFYLGDGLDPNAYVARDYAAPEVRMRALIRFMRAVPQAAENIRGNLKMPMPVSYIDMGVSGFGGLSQYYVTDARAAFADVKDPELKKQLTESSDAAAKAMKGLADWLESNRGSGTQDFALGKERFLRMLKTTEGVDIDLDTLKQVGTDDLRRNQAALSIACAEYAPGLPIPACMEKMNADKPKGNPVSAAKLQLKELRKFVTDKDIVSIPAGPDIEVKEAPPYNRQNFAYMDPPAPMEKGAKSTYYIAPPDPKWTKAVQAAFVPGEADLLFTTVHEGMPGHYLQFLHANRDATLFGKLFVGYAFAEGWAHYTEEMMWDAGLRNGDPETHVGQIANALLRDCRFLSAIGLHAEGMTEDESEDMFERQCYQDKGNATQQAARGTYDPAYLNYTMGKLLIRRLRDDWSASRGGRKAWKAFHEQFLSFGGPPIPLVRQRMMGEPTPKAVF